MERAEYIECITKADNNGGTWCGNRVDGFFKSIDHAAFSGLNGMRVVACTQCTEAIIKALTTGQETS